jgi:hypothetical protein
VQTRCGPLLRATDRNPAGSMSHWANQRCDKNTINAPMAPGQTIEPRATYATVRRLSPLGAYSFLKLKNAFPASPDKRTLWLPPETVMRIEPPVLYCSLKNLPA